MTGENRKVDPLLGRVIAGRYRLTRRVGSGGMGVVYLAVQEGLEREVVVKVIHPDAADDPTAVARFAREGRTAASVVHPNIVTVHDFGSEDDGLFYLVMERLVGVSLRDVILVSPDGGGPPERVALEWPFATECVRQIALALAAAHAKDVLHRDLKPSNVFLLAGVGHHHVAKVLDFGLAKLVRAPGDALTRSGEMIGTVGYASPEQLTEGMSDRRSDLFSLGVVWYELLTGKHPFQAETEASTIVNQVQLVPAPPSKLCPEIPPDIDTIVMRLLAKDPTRRTPSAEELLFDIDALVDGAHVIGASAPPADDKDTTRRIPLRTPKPKPKSKRWPSIAAGFVTLVAVCVLAFALAASTPPVAPPGPAAASTADVVARAVAPLPPQREREDHDVVELGRYLYHDPILSGPNTVACSTCHPMENGGTTPEPQTRLGITGVPAKTNTPTIWNAIYTYRQTWFAAFETIAAVIDRPLFNPDLMGAENWEQIEADLREHARYPAAFDKAGLAVDRRAVGKALTAYIEHATPRGAPFDRFLDGDRSALDPLAHAGWERFQSLGCVSCHQGAGIGGNMVHVYGLLAGKHPYGQRGQCKDGTFCRGEGSCGADETCTPSTLIRPEDLGIVFGDPTRDPSFMFKVPSLRNVARTAPYFHDGSARTLPEAVRTMGRLQLGLDLSADDVKALTAFLESLTGKLPDDEVRLAGDAMRWVLQ